MGFLRRMLGGKDKEEQEQSGQQVAPRHVPASRRMPTPRRVATPGEMLDYLERDRANAEAVLLDHFRQCPECESNYLRVGAWAKGGEAGWTVSCVNCGHVLDRTLEITAG